MSIAVDQLSSQVQAFTAWKQSVSREISRYRGWLNAQGLNNEDLDERLSDALKTLKVDRILLAFVGEFSRGKSELINALLGKHYGQRLMPTRIGRTTMCPTELFYDATATGAYIKLLPIQTRAESKPLALYKQELEHWVHLPINLDDSMAMKKAFVEVAQTRQVSRADASALGFQVEYLEPVLDRPDHVHIPAWRHALINIDHPLLRQGLAIIDTPGLNAMGSEPELTLSLLPEAQALVFVMQADAGVTASDFQIWNEHVRDIARRRGTVLYACLNKVDLLWDEDVDQHEIDVAVARLCKLTAQQLDLPVSHVLPLSAKQGFKARITGETELLRNSRIDSLDAALGSSVVQAKEANLKATLVNELAGMIEASRQSVLAERVRINAEERVLTSGQRDLEYELVATTRAVQAEQNAYTRRLALLQQSRKLIEQQLPRLQLAVSPAKLELHFRTAKEAVAASRLNGVPAAVNGFFQGLIGDLVRLKTEVDTTEHLIKTLYLRYTQETGSDVPPYPQFDSSRVLRELSELENQAAPYKKRFTGLLGGQEKQVDRFFDSIANEAGNLYEKARTDAERWCKQALAPLMQQTLEAKQRLERQMAELQKLKSHGANRGQDSQSINKQRESLSQQQALLEDILSRVTGAPVSSVRREAEMA